MDEETATFEGMTGQDATPTRVAKSAKVKLDSRASSNGYAPDDLIRATERWLDALANASGQRAANGVDESSVVRREISRRNEPRFEECATRVVAWARGQPDFLRWEDAVRDLAEGFRQLLWAYEVQFDPIDYSQPKEAMVRFCRPAAIVDWFRSVLLDLGRLASAGRPPPTLTPHAQKVWDALQGKKLMRKHLAKKLRRSEDSIGKSIESIRKTGRIIISEGQQGYYRPDAPPAEVSEQK